MKLMQQNPRYSYQQRELQKKLDQIKSRPKEINNIIDSGLNLLSELPNTYHHASAILKQQILGSIFYEKLSFDGKKCRTPKMNPVIDLISSHNVEFKKKKQPLKKRSYPLMRREGDCYRTLFLRIYKRWRRFLRKLNTVFLILTRSFKYRWKD